MLAPTLFLAKVLVLYPLTKVTLSSVVPWLPVHSEVRTGSPFTDQVEDCAYPHQPRNSSHGPAGAHSPNTSRRYSSCVLNSPVSTLSAP